MESIIDKGTTFSVSIPLQVAPQRQESASMQCLKKNLNILLVNQKCRKWFKQLLENLSCNVQNAFTFNEALFLFKDKVQQNLDIVFIDNSFKRIQILNCINAMREIEEMYNIKRKIKIFILTKDKNESLDCYSISDQHDGIFPMNANAEEVISNLQKVVNYKARCEVNKVLIVDDEESNIFNLSLQLEDLDVPYFTARNGQQAVQIYSENKSEIGMIIIDNEMPIMNGAEAIQAIKKIRFNSGDKMRKCIIVMLSGDDQKEIKQKAIKAGADKFRVKPLFKNQLEDLFFI